MKVGRLKYHSNKNSLSICMVFGTKSCKIFCVLLQYKYVKIIILNIFKFLLKVLTSCLIALNIVCCSLLLQFLISYLPLQSEDLYLFTFSFYTLFCFVLFDFLWNTVDSDGSGWKRQQ